MQPFTRPDSVVMNGLVCANFKAIDMQVLYFESRLRDLIILIFRVLYSIVDFVNILKNHKF